MEKMILGIPDLAQLMGRTEASIRLDLARKNWYRIPRPVKLGHHATWTLEMVREWYIAQAKEQGITIGQAPPEPKLIRIEPATEQEKTKIKRGRPRGSKYKVMQKGPLRRTVT